MKQMIKLLEIEQHEFGYLSLRAELIEYLEQELEDVLCDRYVDCVDLRR